MQKSRLPSFKDIRQKSVELKPRNENKQPQTTTPASLHHFALGDRVVISGTKQGVICYFGTTHFAAGEWYGIELDAADGKHNGEVEGHRYFTCKEQHGIFAPKHKVEALIVEKSPPARTSDAPKPNPAETKVESQSTVFERTNAFPSARPSNLKKSKMLSKSSVCLGMSETLNKSPKKTGRTTFISKYFPQKLSSPSAKDTNANNTKDATADVNANSTTLTTSKWSSQFDIKPTYETMSTSRFRLDDIFYEDDSDADNNNLEQTIAQLLKKPTPQFARSTVSIAPPIPDLLMPSECHVRPSTSQGQGQTADHSQMIAGGIAQSVERDVSSASFGDILNELELDNGDMLALEAQQCTEAIKNQDLSSGDIVQFKSSTDYLDMQATGEHHLIDTQNSIAEETADDITVDDDASFSTSMCSASENPLNSTFTSTSTAMEVDERQQLPDADNKATSTVPSSAANSSRSLRRPSAIAKFSTFVRRGSSQPSASATGVSHSNSNATKLPPPAAAAAKKSPPVSKPPSPDVTKKPPSVVASTTAVKPSTSVALQRRTSMPHKSAIQKLQSSMSKGKDRCSATTLQKSKKLSVPSSPTESRDSRLSEESSEASPEHREKGRRNSSIPGFYHRRPSDTAVAVTSSMLPRFHSPPHGHHHGDGPGSKSAAHSNKSSSIDLRCKSPVYQGSDSQLSESETSAKYGSKSNIPVSLKRKSFVDISDVNLMGGVDLSHNAMAVHEVSAKKALFCAASERRLSLAARAGSHPDVSFWYSGRHSDGIAVAALDGDALRAARQSLHQADRCKEALLLVIRHATQQTENVAAALHEVKVSNGELRARQEQLEAELKSVREAKQQQMRQWWQAEREEELAAVKQAHLLELQRQAHLTDQKVAEMETAFAGRMRLEHDEKVKVVKNLQQDNNSKLDAMKRQHDAEVHDMQGRFDCLKSSLMDSVNSLQGELHELKQREKVYMDTLRQSSNDEVQAAVACFQQLPLELDGLRVVLDMRTQDVHNLRAKIVELERQLEELTAARDIIKAQQQKIENLQAVVELRQEYERDLTEKHRVLLRKYDHESKQLKRLSMNNEQMAWRLSMGASEGGSSDHETLPSWAQRSTPRGASVSRQVSDTPSPLPH